MIVLVVSGDNLLLWNVIGITSGKTCNVFASLVVVRAFMHHCSVCIFWFIDDE